MKLILPMCSFVIWSVVYSKYLGIWMMEFLGFDSSGYAADLSILGFVLLILVPHVVWMRRIKLRNYRRPNSLK